MICSRFREQVRGSPRDLMKSKVVVSCSSTHWTTFGTTNLIAPQRRDTSLRLQQAGWPHQE